MHDTTPLATTPLATTPLATGPLATGPLATGPLATGPLATGPLATGENRLKAGLPPELQNVHGRGVEERRDLSAAPPETSKRAAWRERLVQAERGIGQGVRSDSTLCVHFFTGSIVLAAGSVIGLGLLQWALVSLSLTVVFAAEMFNQALKALLQDDTPNRSHHVKKVLGISTAAALGTITGAAITLGLVFYERLSELLYK